MKVEVSKNALLRLMQRCQGVATKKSTMPALANVLIAADGDRLTASATDLFLSVTGSIDAEVKDGGAVALPARDVFERVRHMPDGPVSISTVGATTTIKAGGSARRYRVHGIPGDDFPALPAPPEGAQAMDLPVGALLWLMQRTAFSISGDETRAHLNSALLEADGDTLRMVSTDGHRLSKAERTVEGLGRKATMLIPLKAVHELKRLLEEVPAARRDEETVTVKQGGHCAFFAINDVDFSVKLVDAQFPPYEAVIPEMSADPVRIHRDQLESAIKAVSVAASDKTGGVKLALSDGALRIEAETPDGSSFDEVPVDYNGLELAVGFSAKYILDVLAAIKDDDEVTLGLSGELDPAVVRPANGKGGDEYIAVIMPMRI